MKIVALGVQRRWERASLNRRLMSAWNSDWQAGPDYATLANVLAWYETLYVQTEAAPAPPVLNWETGKSYLGVDLDPYRNGNRRAMGGELVGNARKRRAAPYPEPAGGAADSDEHPVRPGHQRPDRAS